jgi:hypothetical protein
MMVRGFGRLVLAAAALALLAAVMTACGGSGGNTDGPSGSSNVSSTSAGPGSGEVVARVGSTPITRATVNHWMATLAGGDYYELSAGHTVPEQLVSDPPRYGVCVSHLEAAAASAPFKAVQPSGVQLLAKCRELYQALRSQAVTLLVEIEWIFGLAAEEGVTVTDAEVLAAYKNSTAERFPSPALLSRNQAAKRISISDELLLIRRDLLSERIVAKLKSKSGRLSGLSQLEARWRPRIDCRPGYVAEHCKQFNGAPPPSPGRPPASILMEQVATLATGHCTNIPACGKQ